jgi:hypothetical protein
MRMPVHRPRSHEKLPKSSLKEGNVADVDRYHQHIQYRAPIGTARIGAPLARQANAIGLGIFQHKLRGWKAAGDIDAVVVAAELESLIKEEILNLAMRLYRARKIDTQHPPRLLPLLPGRGLLDAEVVHRKSKGRCQGMSTTLRR